MKFFMGRAGPLPITRKIDGLAHQRLPMTNPEEIRILLLFF